MKKFVIPAVMAALAGAAAIFAKSKNKAIDLKNVNGKVEDGVVKGYKKIEDNVVGGYKKVEDSVVGAYKAVEDKFVDTFLKHDGETVSEAKERLKNQQYGNNTK